MPVRDIRYFGDPVLRSATDPINRIDDSVHRLVRDLLDTVAVPGRAGVAATQIGVGLRAFSYNVNGVIGYVLNPVLVEVRGSLAWSTKGVCRSPVSPSLACDTRLPV